MIMGLEVFFWFLFLLICSHYVLFGLVILLLGLFVRRTNQAPQNVLPRISFIVAAYNEERILKQKIENDLLIDYPRELLEYIVVSDGSGDSTAEIASEFKDRGVISLHSPERRGKSAALNRAVAVASGQILVFSDANSFFERLSLRKLMSHFGDSAIGGVSGRKSISGLNNKRRASLGDLVYWEYESRLKNAESKLSSIPTADGEIFALRKELFSEIPESLINDDMVLTFEIIAQGYRVIYEPEAVTYEEASISLKDDFNVKARMVYGGFQVIEKYWGLLNPFRSYFGFQFFIHKGLRYLMWLMLGVLFLTSLTLSSQGSFYGLFLAMQVGFYLFALIGFFLERKGLHLTLFYLPYYYCNVNLAAFKGFILYLKKSKQVEIWKKAAR